MKVIVTGFDPFDTFDVNPSREAVSRLPDFVKLNQNSEAVKVAKLELPTCCTDAFEKLCLEVEASADDDFALVLSGLASSRDKICLEKFALNERHYRGPDNNGHDWQDEIIHEGGPDAIKSRLPLRSLVQFLNQNGFAADLSHHAGTFVCNETYYRSLYRWQEKPNCRGIVFVHLPPYESYKHSDPSYVDEREPLQAYTDALAAIAAFIGG
ncbi:MAG: pyroglutamyl-peptidase I [Candidatus Obscuribacterales bacterium]|nr:pyroglutamyl-peptidase I [Candidatus Obscuribacterales bacterium]